MEEDKGKEEISEQKKEREHTLDSPIEDFLSKINLSQHTEKLKKGGYNSVRDLESFPVDDKINLEVPIKILLEYVTNIILLFIFHLTFNYIKRKNQKIPLASIKKRI